MLGQSRVQVHPVHGRSIYDLEVDTTVASAEACALQIKQRLEARAPDAFKGLKSVGVESPSSSFLPV